jgi:hypothetical protein
MLAVASLATGQERPLNWPVVEETGPNSVVGRNMAELEAYHQKMIRHPPRVWLHPVQGPSNLNFPTGFTDGIDDPSASRMWSQRESWTNMDTLAYTQHVWREHRRTRNLPRHLQKAEEKLANERLVPGP